MNFVGNRGDMTIPANQVVIKCTIVPNTRVRGITEKGKGKWNELILFIILLFKKTFIVITQI